MLLLNNENFSIIRKYSKRKEYKDVLDYLNSSSDKVLAVSGLRRTGKTVLLSQLFLELTEDKCDFILLGDNEPIENIIKHIDNSNKNIFLIDEVTRIRNIDDISILYDKYTKYGKKIIISGTESLLFKILKDYTLYDRVDIIELLPLPYNEYKRLTNGSLEDYIDNSGLFYGNTDNLLLSISQNIIKSLEKLNGETAYYNEIINSMIKILFLKIVWTEELVDTLKFSAIGLRKKDVNRINADLMSKIIKRTPEIQYVNSKELEEVYNYLVKLRVITEFESINRDSRVKKMIPIPGLLNNIYEQIVKYCIENEIFISKKLINGMIFEKEMNIQSYIRNPRLPRYTLDTSSEEVDEVIETDREVIVVDYKVTNDDELVLKRTNMNNINEIIDKFEKYFKKEVKYIIAYNGETKYNKIQFKNVKEFLSEIEEIDYQKEKVIKWI